MLAESTCYDSITYVCNAGMYVLVVCLVSTSLASRPTGLGLQIYLRMYVYQASHCNQAIKFIHNIVFQVIWYVQCLSKRGNTTIHLHA